MWSRSCKPSPLSSPSERGATAYTTFGEGPLELLCIPGFVSHLELMFEASDAERYLGRMASFARVVMYDKRGQGLSDRPSTPPTLEQSMEDARAMLDSAGVERVAVFGISEGGPMSTLLAASYPDRVSALVLYGTWPRLLHAEDCPEGVQRELFETFVNLVVGDWGGPVALQL
jgi:pimeloyl-ACP methyl ester carboxylesterase